MNTGSRSGCRVRSKTLVQMAVAPSRREKLLFSSSCVPFRNQVTRQVLAPSVQPNPAVKLVNLAVSTALGLLAEMDAVPVNWICKPSRPQST